MAISDPGRITVNPVLRYLYSSILFFGALNLFAIGLVGEYVAKIMEEVKGRPRLIRSVLLRNGETTQLLPAKDFRQ